MADLRARAHAAAMARAISFHHQACGQCAQTARNRGRATGPLRFTRNGLERDPCARERLLFAQLERDQAEGWPA
jgi:hypothetical protein